MKNTILLDDAINHILPLLDNEVEINQVKELIYKNINEKNHFWGFACINFYYGKISVSRCDEKEIPEYSIIKIKLGSPYKEDEAIGNIFELIPYSINKINVGSIISDRTHIPQSPKSKYVVSKPNLIVISIDGDNMVVEYTYKYRKIYTVRETWSKKQTEIDICRQRKILIK
jgi:hypothetical protein